MRIALVVIALVLAAWRHPPPPQDWYLVTVEWRVGGAELPASSAVALDEVALAIKAHPEWSQIEIGAYGDRGSRARRQRLGVRRAIAFVHGLEARGVAPERLRVVVPPFDPRASGSSIEIRVRERRSAAFAGSDVRVHGCASLFLVRLAHQGLTHAG